MQIALRLLRQFAILWVIATCLGSCTGEPDAVTYPTLVGRFADEGNLQQIIGDQAFISDSEFFVRFNRGEDVVYGGGDWANRIQLTNAQIPESAGPYILPLEYQQAERWNDMPDKAEAVTILQSDDWQEFRDSLFAAVLPHNEKAGSVLDFGVDDYFLYFDDDDKFQATVIQEKPGDYRITDRVAIAQFMQLGWPLFETFMQERGISADRVAFNTGDTGDYSLPFVYVNRELNIVVFVRQPAQKSHVQSGSSTLPYVQTAGHVAQSHLGGIVFRPVSSIYRLLFVASDAVAETITPDWLIGLDGTPVPPVVDGPGMDLRNWEASLNLLTGRSASKGYD